MKKESRHLQEVPAHQVLFDPSHVLLAIGLPHEVAHGSLRLTLCEENTPEQIEYIIKEVPGIVSYLRDISPIWEELEKGEKKHVI